MKKIVNLGQKPKAEYSDQVCQNEVLTQHGIFQLNFPVSSGELPTYLKDFQCIYCNQYLSDYDISQSNYHLWIINEVDQITRQENIHGFGDGKPAYEINFRLKGVKHRICPKSD